MLKQGAIGKRIERAIKHMSNKEYEDAFIQTCIAIDGTGRKKWPKAGVGERIRRHVEQYEAFIYHVWSRGGLNVNGGVVILQGKKLPALQYIIRNSLLHGDDLENDVVFDTNNPTIVGVKGGKPLVGYGIIDGLLFSVVVDPANASETCDPNLSFIGKVGAEPMAINLAWGNIEYFAKAVPLPMEILCKHTSGDCP